jgi:CheY-like chemotaxis protein
MIEEKQEEKNKKQAKDFQVEPLKSVRVLLVEDNPVNQEVGMAILGGMGCRVTLAKNGEEAIVASQRYFFDIILMDCQMPVMDGYTATKKIREIEKSQGLKSHIPVIALTAHATTGDREKCIEAGMDDYLSKPFKMADLLSVIKRNRGEIEKIVESANMNNELSQSGTPIFNADFLDELKKASPDSWNALVLRILNLFHENTPKLIEEIKRGSIEKNVDMIRRAAHSLKSSAANIGAMNMAAYCKELEHQAAEKKLEIPEEVADILIIKYQEVQRALGAYTGSLNG